MAFVRLLKDLMRDKEIGQRIVPIIPDEARTFGMDSHVPDAEDLQPARPAYTSVDRDLMLAYKESTTGQILHEGINEAGSVASFTAAGTSYATHGEPMIPVYIFYSMFGFQRTGDAFWAAVDQMARGFVIGATAGRTTLNGEGLQHADGHSPLLAATNPAVVAYDPAFGYELGHIVRDGLRRMYGESPEDVFYYLTRLQRAVRPAGRARGRRRRGHPARHVPPRARRRGRGPARPGARVRCRGAVGARGPAAAARGLGRARRRLVGHLVERAAPRRARRRPAQPARPDGEPRTAYVTAAARRPPGPVVAVTDYMRAVQDQIRAWVPSDYATLGTDGLGLSDTRGALRRHFLVDAESIAVRTLASLAARGEVGREQVAAAIARYSLTDPSGRAGNTGRRLIPVTTARRAPPIRRSPFVVWLGSAQGRVHLPDEDLGRAADAVTRWPSADR